VGAVIGLDFLARGLEVVCRDRRLIVSGPEGWLETDLVEQLDFEIVLRLDSKSESRTPKAHRCDHCGDLVGHGVVCPERCPFPDTPYPCRFLYGGTCFICPLSWQRASDIARGKR
jgi:hypothetical protein